jgi:hypothetical protein
MESILRTTYERIKVMTLFMKNRRTISRTELNFFTGSSLNAIGLEYFHMLVMKDAYNHNADRKAQGNPFAVLNKYK